MANLQAHLRNLCSTYWYRPFNPIASEQPCRLLQAVNRLLYDNTAEAAFATLFFAEFDDRTKRLRYANCGHPPGLLIRSDNYLERFDSTGSVLGLSGVWDGGVEAFQLRQGDTLALYRDGVAESFKGDGDQFGEERLVEVLQRHRELSPLEMLSTVVDQVRQFNPHEQADDITVIIAKCK